ncbi:MAG: polyprenyl synthetase family protein [Microbacteriaceae bacterium]|nr:polyprenyl synthetase family protein [Microbacteriaceae bacterium]
MPGSPRLVDLVQRRIDSFLDERATELRDVSSDLDVLEAAARGLLAGGKRFRALFCYWGWQSVSALGDGNDPAADSPGTGPVVAVAAALELFHAAALVHDDIMDNSDLRRGEPSLHRRFETLHTDRGWSGSAEGYGRASALLLGDLLLGWSDGLFEEGLAEAAAGGASARTGAEAGAGAAAARAEFARMRTEVMLGQYLDMLEEHSWRGRPDAELLTRAHRVVVYKAAKYSVEAPLAIGASLAGASLPQLTALREYGLPLGVAFQLRDDLLGVYGDPAATGKPAGDDLREGKRTVLIALARQALPGSAARLLDELLGDPDLDAGQIAMLQASIRDSGAVDQIERIIAHNAEVAVAAIADAPLARTARDELAALAATVTRRDR